MLKNNDSIIKYTMLIIVLASSKLLIMVDILNINFFITIAIMYFANRYVIYKTINKKSDSNQIFKHIFLTTLVNLVVLILLKFHPQYIIIITISNAFWFYFLTLFNNKKYML